MQLAEWLYRRRPAPFLFDVVALPISRHTARFVVAELRDLPESSRVLDVGVGTGLISSRVARELGMEVHGVDVSDRMLERAHRRLPDAILSKGNISGLPAASDGYDVVLVNHVLKYVDLSQREAVIGELSRVAKPQARLILSDLILPPLRPGFLPAARSLDNRLLGIWSEKREFVRGLEQAGFVLQKVRYPLLSFMMVFQR